ncbi:hypothetical protein SAMN05216436_10192 [bacterium A37T11]|nr:hypothetical protein SAMN05216436_10192 [bacterium A37T11]
MNGKLKILTQNEIGFVSIAETDGLIHLSFKNLLLNFSTGEFLAFRNMTKRLAAHNCLIPFPDGTQKIILRTPFEGIHFSFDVYEIQELANLMAEACYMKEIYGIIHRS